jgi:hypothetical protein
MKIQIQSNNQYDSCFKREQYGTQRGADLFGSFCDLGTPHVVATCHKLFSVRPTGGAPISYIISPALSCPITHFLDSFPFRKTPVAT